MLKLNSIEILINTGKVSFNSKDMVQKIEHVIHLGTVSCSVHSSVSTNIYLLQHVQKYGIKQIVFNKMQYSIIYHVTEHKYFY